MSSGSITLVAVAERTATLAVACRRCDRAGRYRLDTLIDRHGDNFGIPLRLYVLSRIARNGDRCPSTIFAAFIVRSCPRCSTGDSFPDAHDPRIHGRKRALDIHQIMQKTGRAFALAQYHPSDFDH
jgi:hypothetical protein